MCRCDVSGQDNTHVEGHSFEAIATPVGRLAPVPFPPFHRLPAGSMPRHYTSRPFPTDLALEAEHAPVHQRRGAVHSYERRMKKRKGMDETCQLMILVAAGDRCCLAGIVSFSLKLYCWEPFQVRGPAELQLRALVSMSFSLGASSCSSSAFGFLRRCLEVPDRPRSELVPLHPSIRSRRSQSHGPAAFSADFGHVEWARSVARRFFVCFLDNIPDVWMPQFRPATNESLKRHVPFRCIFLIAEIDLGRVHSPPGPFSTGQTLVPCFDGRSNENGPSSR